MDKEREDQCEWIRRERINVSVHRISKSNCNKQGEGGKAAASTTIDHAKVTKSMLVRADLT